MTIEEAIEILDLETRVSALAEYGYWAGFQAKEAELAAFEEACRVACDALRAQQESGENASLILEELREMDGEPVWNDTTKRWAIVDTHSRTTTNVNGCWRPFSDRYYRRKPEEV